MSHSPTQVSGRADGMAARRASLHQRASPRTQARMLDRLTRSWMLWLSRLEQVKDVLRARCGVRSGR